MLQYKQGFVAKPVSARSVVDLRQKRNCLFAPPSQALLARAFLPFKTPKPAATAE
jgi:hypothetical protein